MAEPESADNSWSRLIALSDPVRRQLYEYVCSRDGPVHREEAATSVGISRTLAAYHLDRLTEAGLLTTSYARTSGRSGPGAGRPAKHYERAQDEVSITVPPRSYDLLARLLAEVVAADDSGRVTSALMMAADAEGRATAADSRDLVVSLRGRGYQPVVADNGSIDLHNCPFHHLAQEHTQLVCGVNLALLRGCLSGRGEDPDRADLRPRPGRCCVTIRPAAA